MATSTVRRPSATRPIDLYLRRQRLADRQLARLLLAAAEDAEKRVLARAGDKISDQVARAQMNLVANELRQQMTLLWPDIENVVQQGILDSAEAAAEAENLFTRLLYESAGLPAAEMAAAVRATARQGAENLFSRQVAGRNLSQRVYRTSVGAQGMLQRRINMVLAQGGNWRRLASEVRGLIDPRTPGGVSYSAQRLARTELNNAFHETQQRRAQANPFVTGMKWNLSSSHPEADICDSYAHDDHEGKGEGVYSKNNVPSKPHPQDLCYLTPEVVDDKKFAQQFHAGQYDEYLDSLIEPMPVPDAAGLVRSDTDALGQFVLKKREEGWSWARIANEAKAQGLSNTSSPGAMRAVARKHGISNTGPIKKGTKTTTKQPPPATPPPAASTYQIGDVVRVPSMSVAGETELIQLTRVPSKFPGSNFMEFTGRRISPRTGRAIGKEIGRVTDANRASKVTDFRVKPPTAAARRRAAAKEAAGKRTSGVAEREVGKYFRKFEGYDEVHVAKMQRKYKELADEYLHDRPGRQRELPMVRGKFNASELKQHNSAYGLYGGQEGATIRLHERYFNRYSLRQYIRDQEHQVRTKFKAHRDAVDNDIYTFVHEFGHHIESVITSNSAQANKLDGLFNDLFNYFENKADPALIPQSYETLSRSVQAERYGSQAWTSFPTRYNAVIERFKPEITNEVSKYATENWMEFMAECFAEYKLNPRPRPVARMVGEFIDRMLKP